MNALITENKNMRCEIESKQMVVDNLADEMDIQKQEIWKYKSMLNEKEKEIKFWKKETETLTSSIDKLKVEKKYASNMIMNKDDIITEHSKQNKDVKERLQKLENEKQTDVKVHEATIKSKDEKIESLGKELEILRDEIGENKKILESMKEREKCKTKDKVDEKIEKDAIEEETTHKEEEIKSGCSESGCSEKMMECENSRVEIEENEKVHDS